MYRIIKPIESNSEAEAQVSAIGYTNQSGNNNTTLGIFRKMESQDSDAAPMPTTTTNAPGVTGLKEKYKSCIRQLPPKPQVETLLVTYFRESNTQYYPMDEFLFRDQLQTWYSLPFATLNKGPLELSADMQFFPALLFQVLASALQFQPTEHDPSLDTLKYAAGMTLDDLASDYSESGMQILHLLGKRRTTLLTVQAGYLRTQYLKICGLVPESWHSLGQTIRDAQEIGLHKDQFEHRPRKAGEGAPGAMEMLWIHQLRRRLWLILALWDLHMAIVLGRPTTVDSRDPRPPFPIDAPYPKNYKEEAPAPRKDTDPPTCLTKILWIAELGGPLYDIYQLERDDPTQSNFAKVQKMHELFDHIRFQCPKFFRFHNPDTSFDSLPECFWLPGGRAYLQSIEAFTLMALHRPYIFTSKVSRAAALAAALDVLRGQKDMFNLATSIHHKLFSLVLATFDAIVLIAAIYVLHPSENQEILDEAVQHVQWGIDRFTTMSARNSLARSALGVLKAIYVRLQKVLHRTSNMSSKTLPLPVVSPQATPQNLPPIHQVSPPAHSMYPPLPPLVKHESASPVSSHMSSHGQSPNNVPIHTYTMPTISNMTSQQPLSQSQSQQQPQSHPLPPSWNTYQNEIPAASNVDFSSLQPLQPMHDLLFNDLGGTVGNYDFSAIHGMDIPLTDGNWQFAGDFTTDSFWGVMNQYRV